MKKLTKNKSIDPRSFSLVEKETGEEIPFRKGELRKITDSGYSILESKNYITIDLDILMMDTIKDLPIHLLGLVLKISENLAKETNIFRMEDGVPHTTASIAKKIGKSVDVTKNHLKELESKDVIWYGKFEGVKGKVYVLNPYLCRSSKMFFTRVLLQFDRFRPYSNGKRTGFKDELYWDSTSTF